MIRIHLPHNYLGLVAGCLCLGSLAASCVSDDLGCIEDRPGYVEGNDIWLTFTLKGVPGVGRSASGISRADDSANHPEEEATAAENKINTDDMRLILFDNRRNVIKVLERKDLISFITTDGENNSRYEIKARINKAYFDFATTSTGDIEISLMLLANLSSGVTSSSNNLTDALFMKSAQWIAQQKYAFQPVWSAENIWFPDGSTTCIPMSGWAHYTIKSAALDEATTIENALQLTTDASPLLMQRAMAKIRVFDNINKENPDAATTITAVRIEGGNAYGAFIPDFSQTGCASWAAGTAMVETATVNTSWFDATRKVMAREVVSADGGDYTDADGNVFETAFIAYVTESAAAQDVKLVITTESENDNGAREWEFPFSRIMNPSSDITRNHIYEFTVTRSMSTELNITLNVVDWESHVTDWDYSENIGIQREGSIKWDPATCSINTETARVVVRDDWTPAQCSFTIDTPVGAEWRAIFVPEGSTPNTAFQFVDENGQPVGGTGESVAGLIDGSKSVLRIRPANVTTQTANVVRLYVVVTLPDGRTMTADVCNGTYGNNKYCTIIQNPQL